VVGGYFQALGSLGRVHFVERYRMWIKPFTEVNVLIRVRVGRTEVERYPFMHPVHIELLIYFLLYMDERRWWVYGTHTFDLEKKELRLTVETFE
jgi:hypothetical protein